MLISYIDREPNEFTYIVKEEHIQRVWGKIESNFDRYFDIFLQSARQESADFMAKQIAEKWGASISQNKEKSKSDVDPYKLAKIFQKGINKFLSKQKEYQRLFNEETFEEYIEDIPDEFKKDLNKKCPIIRACLRSEAEQMKEWKYKYAGTTSRELLDIFHNLFIFHEEFTENTNVSDYREFNALSQFEFDTLDEEEYGKLGVIGGGIRSTVLYHLNPNLFSRRGRVALIALFFLTDKDEFGLPSGNSEFVMVDDTKQVRNYNLIMDYNYWYPYGLYTLYAIRLYRKLEQACVKLGMSGFDEQYRYVYVDVFSNSIWDHHGEYVQTMLGSDQDT